MNRTPLVTGATLCLLLAAAPVNAAASSAGVSPDIANVRAATARYHDHAVAEADGYLSSHECAESPDGVMGYHWVNPAYLAAPMELTRPQVLLYQPRRDGSLRLVAVEYLAWDADQDLATDDDRPILFDRGFEGPMLGHEPGMPIHYDLHVWVWQHNPDGIFATWNPAGSCGTAP
jgi:hypothetical protein